MDQIAQSVVGSTEKTRVVKRYSNRKLYDTQESRYVTLLQIAQMVRSGENVQVIDNNTKNDLTDITLAQIIYEEQKLHNRSLPVTTLRNLVLALETETSRLAAQNNDLSTRTLEDLKSELCTMQTRVAQIEATIAQKNAE